MNRITRWIVDGLLTEFTEDDRNAICGDATELGFNQTALLRDLVSLLVRREAHAWTALRPWRTLVCAVLPLGFALSVVSRFWSGGLAISAFMYGQTGIAGAIGTVGARANLLEVVTRLAAHVILLAIWAWSVGRLLRLWTGAAWMSNGVLMTLIVFAGTVGSTTVGMLNPANAAVFSLPTYRLLVPFIVRGTAVVLPLWIGIVHAHRRHRFTVAVVLVIAGIGTVLTALNVGDVMGALFLGWISPSARPGTTAFWWVRLRGQWALLPMLMPITIISPLTYAIIDANRRRPRHDRVIA